MLHVVELLPRDIVEVGSFGEEVTDQHIGIFTSASLPGACGVTEVHFHIRGHGGAFVLSHFFALVPCE